MNIIGSMKGDALTGYWFQLDSYASHNGMFKYYSNTYKHKRSAKRAAERLANKHRFIITKWENG